MALMRVRNLARLWRVGLNFEKLGYCRLSLRDWQTPKRYALRVQAAGLGGGVPALAVMCVALGGEPVLAAWGAVKTNALTVGAGGAETLGDNPERNFSKAE